MKELKFSILIGATKSKVWETLWQDETLRDWASIIDPETYMVGELKEGNEIQFISAHGGYGVTSVVEKLVPNELVLLKHVADTQGEGKHEREKQWTGGKDSYKLEEKDGVTKLTVTFGVPPELEEYFALTYPKSLERIKELAER